MIKKKLTKLVGLKFEDFEGFVQSGQIQVQPARLIPTLKTGDVVFFNYLEKFQKESI